MVVCCLCTSITWTLTKWSSPDVLFFGDSGIDGWAAPMVGDGCTCGCFDGCVDATGNKAWKDLTVQLRAKGITWSHMGMNSAPVSELCCVAPLVLAKNKPKKFIVAQMGANDLVWYPGMVLKLCCVNYPMCSFDWFMTAVARFGQQDLKVVYVPDQISPRVGCACFLDLYAKIRLSAGTVVDVNVPTDALASADAAESFIKNPEFTYVTTKNGSAKYPNLIYIECVNAYDQLIEAMGHKKWIGGMEMSAQVYMHYNQWVVYVLTTAEDSIAKATVTRNQVSTPVSPVTMERD